jgi:hypothetical protein
LLKTKGHANQLLERNTQADTRMCEYVVTLNSYYSALFDTGKLSFLAGQIRGPGKIQLDNIARVDRRGHRNRDKNPDSADVGASAIKKPIGLGYPDADRPAKICPNTLALFC